MGPAHFGLALALMFAAAARDPVPERLYGRVTTREGVTLEGYLRWDRNEANWADLLDAQKEIPWAYLEQAEALDPELGERRRRERSIEAFGVRITWDVDDDARPERYSSSVRFGQLAWLVVVDSRRARLGLRDGGEVELVGTTSDLGRGLRGLVVDDPEGDEVELEWEDLDRVDFMMAPANAPAPRHERLYGTLTTLGGLELSGHVAWDLDEVFTSDVLDGEDESDGADHRIEFGRIAAIQRASARSARVILHTGETRVLRGTNDVNRDNRGIEILDPSFGRAIVPWEEFDALTFHAERRIADEGSHFANGGRLRGTVHTRDGNAVTGWIRWDNDEEAGWEVLDGWSDGIDFTVEFGRIRTIEKADRRGVAVTLRDGRVFRLDGTNDVDEDNKGIFVSDHGEETVLVTWADFERIELEGA